MPNMGTETLVHVIDDDEEVRNSLTFLLELAGMTASAHATAADFLQNLAVAGPAGCVLTDVRMPGMTGMELLRLLSAEHVHIPVIVMTGEGDVPLAVEAMKIGARDFLEKPFDDETLLAAVRGAFGASERNTRRETQRRQYRYRMEALSGRERDVFEGLVAGHSNKVIAHMHGISPRTVEIYRANVMAKMEASSLSELVRMAMIADVQDEGMRRRKN